MFSLGHCLATVPAVEEVNFDAVGEFGGIAQEGKQGKSEVEHVIVPQPISGYGHNLPLVIVTQLTQPISRSHSRIRFRLRCIK